MRRHVQIVYDDAAKKKKKNNVLPARDGGAREGRGALALAKAFQEPRIQIAYD